MMSCPTDDVLRRFADVTLSAEQTERLAAHLAHCERCRAEDARLRILIGDVKAPFPEQVGLISLP